MRHTAPPRTEATRVSTLVLGGLAALIAAVTVVLGHPAGSSSATPIIDDAWADHRGALGEADGVVPDGTTVFDADTAAVANLDRDLLGAVRRATTDAARDGITVYVNSGWRSRDYQSHLLREAVSQYGSEEHAARWVATADTSPHVSGDAIDVGRPDATEWLSEHGRRYGLCQIYRNEAWHFELRPEAVVHGCPAQYADPAHDPRMHT